MTDEMPNYVQEVLKHCESANYTDNYMGGSTESENVINSAVPEHGRVKPV